MLAAVTAAGPAAAARQSLPNTTMRLGSTYTITGQTAAVSGHARATGKVVVTGRLNGGVWRFITQTHTLRNGTYKLRVKPTRRGRLELRIATPDHRVSRVVLTVI